MKYLNLLAALAIAFSQPALLAQDSEPPQEEQMMVCTEPKEELEPKEEAFKSRIFASAKEDQAQREDDACSEHEDEKEGLLASLFFSSDEDAYLADDDEEDYLGPAIIYENAKFGFSCEFPNAPEVKDESLSLQDQFLHQSYALAKEGTTLYLAASYCIELPDGSFGELSLDELHEGHLGVLGGGSIQSVTKTSVEGYEALRVCGTVRGNQAGAYLINKDNVLVIIGTLDFQNFDEEEFERFVGTLKFY